MSGTLDRLKQSLGFGSEISRLISNTDPGIDSIAEVYQALYALHQENLEALVELENTLNSLSSSSGTSGTSGISGTSGSSGTSGDNGTSGSSGTSGDSGTSGSSGISGSNGTSGSSGTSGASGTSGSSGISGANGTSGSSGTSGISGTSGTSGTSAAAPSQSFSPMNVSDCDLAPTAATTQYYYLTVADATMTVSKAKLWGYSGSDTVLFGLYRGTLSSCTLIGTGSAVCGVGPNVINISPVAGQNLNVQSGENLVVGYYANGISWRTVYNAGISDIIFGISNTSDISSMPNSPTGTGTAIRFALTLY
jgi:hypothetical protein